MVPSRANGTYKLTQSCNLIDHKGIIVGQTFPMGEGNALIERKVMEAEGAKYK